MPNIYRIPLANGRRLTLKADDPVREARGSFSAAIDLAAAFQGDTVNSNQGVVFDLNSTTVIDVVLVGSDPGSHGLHVDHSPHPPRFFNSVTKTAVSDGNWSNPAIWSPSGVPSTNDVVRIPTKLTFDNTINTKLTCNLLAVNEDGELTIDYSGTSNTCEIVFADTAIDTALDYAQWGHSLLGLGKVTVYGKTKTPWLRLATEALAGATTVTLASAPTGWVVGDKLVLPDTRQLAQVSTFENPSSPNHLDQGQFDERTVSSVSGAVVTLNSALTYDHKGARDRDGTITFSPAVMNLTRNVLIRSASPSGVRPHLASHGRAAIDIRYVEIRNTGRSKQDPWNNFVGTTAGTNQQGRYGGWHFHHTIGPTGLASNVPQFRFEGNACWNESGVGVTPPRWGTTVHGSHYGLIKDNCVYNWTGAGIVTEDGSETENAFENNYVMRIPQSGTGENTRGPLDIAHSGQGFWFAACNNRVKNNLAMSTSKSFSTVPFMAAVVNSNQPAFKGADPHGGNTSDYVTINVQKQALLEFSGNEGGGRTQTTIDLWNVNFVNGQINPTAATSTVLNHGSWNFDHSGYYNYQTNKVTFDGWTIRGDFDLLRSGVGAGINAIFFSDYEAGNFLVKNSNVQGVNVGFLVATRGDYEVRDTTFSCYRDIENRPIWTTLDSGTDIRARDLTIRNCVRLDPFCSTFSSMGWQGFLRRDGQIFAANLNRVVRDRCFIYDFGGSSSGLNYQVYYPEQAGSQMMDQMVDNGGDVIRFKKAQGGTPTTITLDSGASSTDDFYLNKKITLVFGTGAPLSGPITYRTITAYNGTTKIATVDPAWDVTPDSTSIFAVHTGGYVRNFSSLDLNKTNSQNLTDNGVCTAGEVTPAGTTTLTGVYGDAKAI